MKILTLEHHLQTTDYTCGPATLLSFLNYHNRKFTDHFTEKKLAKILQTCPIVGTYPHQLYDLLKKINPHFKLQKNAQVHDLEKAIDNDHPSIVLWYDEYEWHWSTAIGYNQHNIILLDPYLKDGLNSLPKDKFNTYWSKLAIK